LKEVKGDQRTGVIINKDKSQQQTNETIFTHKNKTKQFSLRKLTTNYYQSQHEEMILDYPRSFKDLA
jgi:hypothetical protein